MMPSDNFSPTKTGELDFFALVSVLHSRTVGALLSTTGATGTGATVTAGAIVVGAVVAGAEVAFPEITIFFAPPIFF